MRTCFIVLLAFTACATRPAGDPFPSDMAVDGWHRTDHSPTFNRAELYGHIDGGAEVFLELGFNILKVQRYTKEADEIDVELYEMADLPAAVGIYRMKCGKETSDPSFSPPHTVNRYQMLFQQGPYYVTIYNREGSKEAGKSLLDFARHVADRLPAGGATDVFALLPEEGRIAHSERVVRGPSTLDDIYTLGSGDVLQLKGKVTALAADYKDHTLIAAEYPDSESAKAAFDHACENLDSYLEVVDRSDTRLVFKDYASRFGTIVLDGNRIEVFVNLQERP
jgi:hypothetical protein